MKSRKFVRIQTEIPGPKSLETFNFEEKYISPGIQTIATNSKIVPVKGEGCIIEDADGNRFIDMFAGVGVASLGYNHPKYVSAMQKQLSEIHVGSFTSKNRAELSKYLSDIAPGNVRRAQYYSSGAEAVEAALRLAKAYTGKNEFLGFWEGFHGKTLGVVGLLGDTFKNKLGPLPAGTYSSPYPNCNHCPFKQEFCSCNWLCLDFLEQKIKYETTGNLAAIVVEPIQGTAGNVVPPDGFLPRLKEIAHKNGALLICDEMICGFGRTGKMWGVDHFGVVPDIMTIGKGFGGGFPMTGLMSNEEVIFSKPFANPSGSSSSYGGNPLASTAAYTTLKIMEEEGLVENSAKVGAFILNKFKEMQAKYPIIGDVRGKGLMIGVELVKDKKTNEKLDKKDCKTMFDECLKNGVVSMCYNPDIRINPPLVISQEVAEEAVSIMEDAIAHVCDTINI